VNKWLLRAPWWALAIAMGLVVGVPFALWIRLGQDAAWPVVVTQTAVLVVVGGPVMGLLVRKQLDRQLDAVGEVPDEIRVRVASRPTVFGRIPQDSAERAATVRLIEHQIVELRRRRVRTVVVGILFTAPLVWVSLTRSPWWWVPAVAWALLVLLDLSAPGLLRRRAELLTSYEG